MRSELARAAFGAGWACDDEAFGREFRRGNQIEGIAALIAGDRELWGFAAVAVADVFEGDDRCRYRGDHEEPPLHKHDGDDNRPAYEAGDEHPSGDAVRDGHGCGLAAVG